MTVVLDSSVLVTALVETGLDGAWAEHLSTQDIVACPELALVESTNVLRRLEASGQLSSLKASAACALLIDKDIELFPFAPFAQRIWSLRNNVTCYDAWYVALAEVLGCPLATMDFRLARASGPTCEILLPPSV